MKRTFRQQSIALLNMLALQFILGMILNLFVNLPSKHPGQSGNYFVRSAHSFGWAITLGGGIALFLHVLVAIGLLVGSIAFTVLAIKKRDTFWVWVSTVALLGILAAFSNGLSFLDFNHNLNSFIMAMGYILATISYVTGIFQPQQKPAKQVRTQP
jgi:hypothetical protein